MSPSSRPIRFARFTRKVVRGLFVHHAFDHAATMAFYFFLGTIPLLVVAGLLIGKFVAADGLGDVTAPIYQLMPGVTGELIQKELLEIAAGEITTLAPLSAAGFLWLTTNGFHNLMDVFELLIGARPRSWMKQRAIAIGWVLGTLLVASICVWFLFVTTAWASGIDKTTPAPEVLRAIRNALAVGWQRTGVLIVFAGVTMVGVAAFYRIAVVHPRGVIRRVWPGTFAAMGLWIVISWGFGQFVGRLGQYSVYYGSLATVAVTLLWFYLTSLSFLIGAEVNAQLEGLRPDPA